MTVGLWGCLLLCAAGAQGQVQSSVGAVPGGTAPAVSAPVGLPVDVQAALKGAGVPAEALAVYIADVQGPRPQVRLAHREGAAMNPASLMKLVTTFAALDLLGPAHVFATAVHVDGVVREGGVLAGNLVIRGTGDPQLVIERLWLLLRRVQGLGIRRIEGDIVLDRSAMQVPEQDPGLFDGEPTRPYNAQPDALLINYKSIVLTFVPDRAAGVARVSAEPGLHGVQIPTQIPLATAGDCGDWRGALRADVSSPDRLRFAGAYPASCGERVWPLAYADPRSYARRAVEALWRDMGGELTGTVREGLVPAGLKPAFEATSPPLAQLVRDINKFSNNVMARQLFLALSQRSSGTGTPEASRDVVARWWKERIGGAASADDALPVLDNGAGLSRQERISAQALARLLQVAWASPLMPDLAASLPLAGVDGTLRRGARLQGAAHLKTGSLRDVAALGGYVHTEGGRRLVLVAIVNHPQAQAARPALEALVRWAARTTP